MGYKDGGLFDGLVNNLILLFRFPTEKYIDLSVQKHRAEVFRKQIESNNERWAELHQRLEYREIRDTIEAMYHKEAAHFESHPTKGQFENAAAQNHTQASSEGKTKTPDGERIIKVMREPN